MKQAAATEHRHRTSTGGFTSTNTRTFVSVDATPDTGCPMHGRNGSYQLPERNSRKEMARELRLSVAREEAAAKRSSSYSEQGSYYGRGHSLEPGGYHSHSVPRRMSAQAATKTRQSVDRKGSFQDRPMARDTFKGKVDFKSTLRRFDPKDDERSHGSLERLRSGSYSNYSSYNSLNNRSSRHDLSNSRELLSPRRGTIIDSDFDFRGGGSSEPNWDNPGRFRYNKTEASTTSSRSSSHEGYHHHQQQQQRPLSPLRNQPSTPVKSQPTRPNNLRLNVDVGYQQGQALRRSESNPISPSGSRQYVTSNPTSPRRVEFGEEIVFDFNPRSRSRVTSPTCGVSSNSAKKPILRQSNSTDLSQQQPWLPREEQTQDLLSQFEQRFREVEQKANATSPRNVPLTIQHANQDLTSPLKDLEVGTQMSNGDSLVQIYVPQKKDKSSKSSETDGENDEGRKPSTSSDADSDSTLEDKSLGLSALRDAEHHLEGNSLSKRKIPNLAEWNRSQSFPTPATAAETDKSLQDALRKHSLPETVTSELQVTLEPRRPSTSGKSRKPRE